MSRDLTQDQLKAIVHYDPETGAFTWLPRVVVTSRDKLFNTRYAGRTAGYSEKNGHHYLTVNDKQFSGSRLAWLYVTGSFPEGTPAHIDGDPRNLRFANLHETSHHDWRRRPRTRHNTRTGVKHVYPHKNGKGFYVLVHDGEKLRHWGSFDTIDAAAHCATLVRDLIHGEWARHV